MYLPKDYMTSNENDYKSSPLEQVEEMIQDLLEAQKGGVNTPELIYQLEGLLQRKEDLKSSN